MPRDFCQMFLGLASYHSLLTLKKFFCEAINTIQCESMSTSTLINIILSYVWSWSATKTGFLNLDIFLRYSVTDLSWCINRDGQSNLPNLYLNAQLMGFNIFLISVSNNPNLRMPLKHPGPHFHSAKDYDQLPLSADGGFLTGRQQEFRSWKIKAYSRQRRRTVIGTLILVGLLVLYLTRGYLLKEPLPPLYKQWLDYEMKLPQHNLELRFPEGQHARYIFNGNHV